MLDSTLPLPDALTLAGGVDPGAVSAGVGETDGVTRDGGVGVVGVDRCVDVGPLIFVLIGGAVRTTGSG